MTLLADGTVVQDGLRVQPRRAYPADAVLKINFPVIGQIVKALPAESADNYPQETWLCDIHVTELGIDLFAVPWTAEKSGPDNYVYVAPAAATKNLDGSQFNPELLKPAVSDGDTVIVIFAYGSIHRPHIIKVLPHNQSGPNGMSPSPRPSAADGDCYKVRFNGTNLFIDKDGNVSFKSTETLDKEIPKTKTFAIDFDNGDGDRTVLTVDSAADKFSFVCANGDQVEISKANGVQISTPAGGGTSASFKSGDIEFEAGNGKTVSIGFKGAGAGKFKVTNATGELIDQLEQAVGTFVDNASAITGGVAGPGTLNPAVVTLLGAVRTFLLSLKA